MAFNFNSNKVPDGGYFEDPNLFEAITYLVNFLDMEIEKAEFYDLNRGHEFFDLYFQNPKFNKERCFQIIGYSPVIKAKITVFREPAGRYYPDDWSYQVSADDFGFRQHTTFKNAVENFRRSNPDYYTPAKLN